MVYYNATMIYTEFSKFEFLVDKKKLKILFFPFLFLILNHSHSTTNLSCLIIILYNTPTCIFCPFYLVFIKMHSFFTFFPKNNKKTKQQKNKKTPTHPERIWGHSPFIYPTLTLLLFILRVPNKPPPMNVHLESQTIFIY